MCVGGGGGWTILTKISPLLWWQFSFLGMSKEHIQLGKCCNQSMSDPVEYVQTQNWKKIQMSVEIALIATTECLCGNLQNCSFERSACQTFKPQKIPTSLKLATQQASLTFTSLIQPVWNPISNLGFESWNNKYQMKWRVWFPRNPFGYHGKEI